MTATTVVRRMQDLTVEEHTLTLPLVWDDPADTRTIDVFAAVVSREGGEDLPYLVFLQGGPGHEAPRPDARFRSMPIRSRSFGMRWPCGARRRARSTSRAAPAWMP